MAKKLGDIIGGLEFSSAEKNRIADSLRTGTGVPYEMFTSHASQIKDSDFWRRAQKKFRVTGFREGHPSAKQMIIRRALDGLKNTEGSKNSEIWPLYRYTAYAYIKDVLKNLNRLLYQEEFDSTDGVSTEKILRSIKAKMPIYDFPNDDIAKLYEIWGFERIDFLDSILGEDKLDIDVVKRIISLETNQLIKKIAIDTDASHRLLSEKIESINNRIEHLSEEAGQAEAKLVSTAAILRTEFQNLAASLLSKKVSEIQDGIKKSLSQPSHPKTPPIDSDALIAIENRVDRISKRVQLLEKGDHGTGSTNPQTFRNSTSGNRSGLTVRETSNQWAEKCRSLGMSEKSLLVVPVILQTLTRTKVVITSHPQLLVDLLKMSGAVIKSTCASPLWNNKSELTSEKVFLETPDSHPKVLVISDFDVALQETYLIPFLIDWIQHPLSDSSKIILVPAHSGFPQVNPRLFEFAWHFSWREEMAQDLRIKLDECDEKFSKLPLVSSESGAICKYQYSTNIGFESDLAKISANEGVVLPPRLMNQFMNVLIGLSDVLSHEDSGNAAVAFSVLPWLRCTRGDAVSRIIEERFRMVFGGT